MAVRPVRAILSLLPLFLQVTAQSGAGFATHYWDCCKPSCAWGNTALYSEGPAFSCDINDSPLLDNNVASACTGGDAYMCTNEAPWKVSDTLSYGFAAVNLAGGESAECCACYELTFTNTSIAGLQMIVQATNTGSIVNNQFDIAVPGGGFGQFTNACPQEFGTPSPNGWGIDYGGVQARSDCDDFPDSLKAGCYWRFDYMQGGELASLNFERVTCPTAITDKSGCIRSDDAGTGTGTGSTTTTTTISVPGSVQTQYGECGNGYPTTCVAGSTCQAQDSYYSQCLAGTAAAGSVSTTTSPPASVQTQYGECGTGYPTCVAGTTCQVQNAYYSQCL